VYKNPLPTVLACGGLIDPKWKSMGSANVVAAAEAAMVASDAASDAAAQIGYAGGANACGVERAVARASVLLPSLSPLPPASLLASRKLKLAHVNELRARPNYLAALLAANLTAPLQPANDENRIGPRRLYLNLGARGTRDASSSLFESYPDAAHWEHHAFEADANFNAAWAAAAKADPRIHHHNVAVWNKDTTLTFGLRKSASHVVEGTGGASGVFGKDRKVKLEHEVVAVDLARWLKAHARDEDFVLVKMDIEGAEMVVLPALIASGAACLIDELYLECHTGDSSDIAKGRTYADCIGLLTALRGVGTASHLWF